MPTVKCRFGRALPSSSKIGLIIDGETSFEDKAHSVRRRAAVRRRTAARRRPWPRSMPPSPRGTAARRRRLAPWCGRARRSNGRSEGARPAVRRGTDGRAGPDHADRLASGDERVDGLLHRARGQPITTIARSASAHRVLNEAVATAGPGRQFVHHLGDDTGHGQVEGVGRLPCLEEHVGVLRGPGGPASASALSRGARRRRCHAPAYEGRRP